MFYTKKINQDIKSKFESIEDAKNHLLFKNTELKNENKSLFEKITSLEVEKDRIYKLISQVESNLNNEITKKINLLTDELERSDAAIDNKLILFRKEVFDEIAGKFFDTLDRIFRTSKEISLITRLIDNNGSDLGILRSQLLKPYIEAKHREERIKQGEAIVNKGQKILEDRNALHEEVIQKQREGKDVSRLKIKLEAYNEILEKLKGA